MLIPNDIEGKVIGVLGLGASGRAAVDVLNAGGAEVFSFDDIKNKNIPKKHQFFHWRDWPWQKLNTMVISPGIPHNHPEPHPAAILASKHGVEIISEIEIALRAKPRAKLIAITGTNGKSTTTALIGHCLKTAGYSVSIGGNLGEPACLLKDPGKHGILVLELSSYQLETTPSLAPSISILLNISPDHLDRHGGMAGYIEAKSVVLDRLNKNGIAIIGNGDEYVQTLAKATIKRGIKTFLAKPSMAPNAQQKSDSLRGLHNAENAAAAALALFNLGLTKKMINFGISSFNCLPHRLQPVASCGKVRFINDSKATNGMAAARALAAYDDIYWIAGGLAKKDGLKAAITHLSSVKKAYLIGTAAKSFAKSLPEYCPASTHASLEEATRAAFSDANTNPNGGIILLSPAAASFDQFQNFAARGDKFSALARDLCASKFKPKEENHA